MTKFIFGLVFLVVTPMVFADPALEGPWDTGKDEVHIQIHEKEGALLGEVVSSGNEKLETGKILIKNIAKDGDRWKAEFYALKKKKWYPAVLTLDGDSLKVRIDAGIRKKTVEWQRAIR
jgi:hypothetical protein